MCKAPVRSSPPTNQHQCFSAFPFSALTPLVGRQEGHPAYVLVSSRNATAELLAVVMQMFELMTAAGQNASWEVLESALYIMISVAKYVDP